MPRLRHVVHHASRATIAIVGMASEPGLDARGLTIRQQREDPKLFQIADDAGASVIASAGPIMNADNSERYAREA
ncbi:hypothetical protein LMTR13_25270 [Bradyrhizobium icense]|uniref:Uncharacterized protein n=1 Tax=Bradyrhizobium icense TaxID=1274631 RepID=A0A1B1UJQ9_9BRAD|nr:hypothetical protein LMTR13_25270 [Bradyrhizobium icense]